MKIKERVDSFSSDDELPLTNLNENGTGEQNSYNSLCQKSVVNCEFCDKVFRSRYNSIKHNATHIIIPLINQNVIECKECGFCFTTQKEHDGHMLKTHNVVNGNCSIQPQQNLKLRNRLKFEDDDCIDLSSDVLDNLRTECELNFNYKNLMNSNKSIVTNDDGKNVDESVFSDQSVKCNGSIGYGVKVNGVNEHYNSVHCDVLKIQKRVRCGRCDKRFPDRYNLIIHEATHMDADRSLPQLCATCDWYVAGNHSDLRRHMKQHAHKNKPAYQPIKHCTHCGLNYRSIVRHANNYHSNWMEEDKYERVLHVCDLCFEFLRSRTDRYYAKQGTISEVGRRHTCNQCTRMFFELNIVKSRQVLHNWGMKKIKKTLTNKQRLGKIQNRLLKLNKLRKL